MTSQGSAYGRFKRALATENLLMIRAAAAELPQVSPEDAMRVCLVLRDREPERLPRNDETTEATRDDAPS